MNDEKFLLWDPLLNNNGNQTKNGFSSLLQVEIYVGTFSLSILSAYYKNILQPNALLCKTENTAFIKKYNYPIYKSLSINYSRTHK